MAVTVSVAMATFNGAAFVEAQLQSILDQSLPVQQIVIADDGSTDDTVDIVRRVLSGWGGELVVLPADGWSGPLGVTRNFERALQACTGDVIALSDQDDLWMPNRVAQLVDALGDGLLVFSNARLVDAEGRAFDGEPTLFDGLGMTDWELTKIRGGDAWAVQVRRNVVTGATALIRRDLLTSAGSFPESWVHDEWLATVAAAFGGVRVLNEVTVDYRQHGANQIGMRTRLTMATRTERLRQPRTERNERLLHRAEALAEWAVANERADVNQPVLLDAQQKLRHEQVRSGYPRVRIARVFPVLREVMTGRYRRFGLGAQDVLRDLVQPV